MPTIPTTDQRIDEYGRQAIALSPVGRAHVVPTDSTRANFLEAFLSLVAGADVRSFQLFVEANLNTTSELLAEWERAFGLPGACGLLSVTAITRRFALIAKVSAQGGQSRQYFIDTAAALGFTITIEEHFHFVVGRGRVGPGGTFGSETFPEGRLWSGGVDVQPNPWTFTWTVRAPIFSPVFFSAGASVAGDRLVTADNSLLTCSLDQIKPAHTLIHYEFTEPPEPGYAPWEILGPAPAVAVCKVGNVLVSSSP